MAKSSEQLPPGWTVQFKALKAGRKIKYYVNLGTGQKFNSEEDLLRYVKAGILQEPQPTDGCIRRRTVNNNVKPVAKENENRDWLPDGWVVDEKIRKSGKLVGRSYKIYIEPLTGCKFFSKPEVTRYLESVKHKISSSKQKKTSNDMHSASKVVVEKSTVADLPPGWIKESKIRKTAYGIKKDPYYTDPVSGYVFRSKKEVHRYLETGEISSYAYRSVKRDVNDPEALVMPITKRQKLRHLATRRRLFPVKESLNASSSSLPEAEALKKRQAKRISAESGLSGANTVEISPEKMVIEKSFEGREISNLDHAAPPKTKCSNRNQGGRAFADKGPVATPVTESVQGKNLLEGGMECSNRESLNNFNKNENNEKLNLPRRFSKRLAGLEPELLPSSVSIERVPKIETTESCKSKVFPSAGLTSNGLPDEASNKLNAGPVILEVGNCASPKVNIPPNREQSDMTNSLGNKSIPGQQMQKLESMRTNDEKSEPCLSFSVGDSSLDSCLEFAFKTLTGQIPVGALPDNRAFSTPAADILQEKRSQEIKMEESCDQKTQINTVKSKKKKDLNLPRRSSKRLAGLEPELVPNSISSERALRNATRNCSESEAPVNAGLDPNGLVDVVAKQLENGLVTAPAQHNDTDMTIPLLGESSNKSGKPLELQTVSEGQHQKLETDQPEGQPQQVENKKMNIENAESQLLFPFGDSWSDPCLEFAFKTLTGAIPVDENLAIQDFFRHQLDHSKSNMDNRSTLPDFNLPSSFQSDVSFTFDASEKQPASQQQLPVNPSFLPPGNVSLPSCSSAASQQPSLERSKEINGKVKS